VGVTDVEGVPIQPTVFVLDVTDDKGIYDGVEIKIRSKSLRELLYGNDAREDWSWRTDTTLSEDDRRAKTIELYEQLAGDVISWNLLHPKTGEPVPPTMDGLLELDAHYIGPILWAWRNGRVRIEDPLPHSSPSGVPSAEASIPMETLSDAQAS
jgi:hypothetical protein